MASRTSHRGSLVVEEARVIARQAHPGAQHVLRLAAPRIAARALPGQFVHVRCDPLLPMRRPMSLLRADAAAGHIDILFKVHGHGTALLATRKAGETISAIGPIGVPFRLDGYRPRPLLIGGGVGLPPMICLAEHMRPKLGGSMFVVLGSEVPFPFTPRPSAIMVPGVPTGAIAAMPLLDDWGIASRLATLQGYAGCFAGYVTDLARCWLQSLPAGGRDEVEVFACGPTPMLKAVRALALEFDLPCQLSLEEYMACAVGGCAGCAVRIENEQGAAMKRVCVDGPVFEARSIIFQ